jgi:hypothetical protein
VIGGFKDEMQHIGILAELVYRCGQRRVARQNLNPRIANRIIEDDE